MESSYSTSFQTELICWNKYVNRSSQDYTSATTLYERVGEPKP
jgi:hypothetical protein